ncbi:unnamed protein product [Cyclocybe aegerita]|uniref:NAD(P)-binding protein n=1 Tax=Cyclocybe aegerita TaxID=1973307 RepID=A0A8S0WGT4_CYCAE|nr:unnamed protein product [Cyclocybe aegerita]
MHPAEPEMSRIPDDKLAEYSHRVKGKVLVITGAGAGIGRQTALLFASYGAKVVIGDLNPDAALTVVDEIEKAGGFRLSPFATHRTAACIKCNVVKFEEQVDMFEFAIKKYGSVDIVVPNAGITETAKFMTPVLENGRPKQPKTTTLDVNLTGVLWTAHLAVHYLFVNKQPTDDLKSLIFIGSVASWQAIPLGELYTASKHAVLGLMRSLHPTLGARGVRVGCIHPFFVETNIVPFVVKVALAGIPFVPIERVAGAIFNAATDPDPKTSGSAYLLLDDGHAFRVPKEQFKMGVYQMIDERANAAQAAFKGVQKWRYITRDVWSLVGKPVVKFAVVVVAAKYAYENRELIENYVRSFIN